MHLLTLTPFYPTVENDASGCFIAEAVGELEHQGIQSSVIAVHPMHRSQPRLDPKAPAAMMRSFISMPGNAGLSTAGSFLYAALKSYVWRIHAQRPISLIHAHTALPCGHAAMLLSEDLGVPYVVSVHGLDVFSTRQVPGWFGHRCAERSQEIYAAAARVICISEKVALPIREKLGEAVEATVLYNGVDPKLFVPGPQHGQSNPVIVSVGNLIEVKGHELLLRALLAVSRDYPRLECRIIGDGVERVRLLALSRALGIQDHVRFLGRRSRREVAQAMSECTLFALPSWYEGLGCVYLEAMSAGCAAIACYGQGMDEIIRHGENGWLVQPKDVHDLANGLHVLLSDPALRDRIGRCGRETILEGLTWKHHAEQLQSIYQACVA